MTPSELADIIKALNESATDTAHIEAKSASGGLPRRLWETLSAFANTPGGGILVLGWSEEACKVVGVGESKKTQQDLASLCDQMSPLLRPLIEIHGVENKKVITAEIPEISFKEKPCHYKGAGLVTGSFIRVADGNRQLTQYEVQGFLDGRGQPVYDVEPVQGSTHSDLSPEWVRSYLAEVRRKFPRMAVWDDEKILLAMRVLVNGPSGAVATLGGLLALGIHPQQFFPGLTAHVMAYPHDQESLAGPDGERLLDNLKVEGPIPSMATEIIRAIKRNLSKRTLIKGLFREDVLEYPELFLREAVANALVHRDYSPLARGSAIQIKIFPNRIEIHNPGGLYGPVTEDQLGEQGLQAARNAFLIKILEDCPVPGEKGSLCENRGTGILHMIQSLRKAGMEPPVFQDHRTYFRVRCFNNTLFDAETLQWLGTLVSFDISEHQRYALAFVRHRGTLTNIDYCRLNDCDSRLATKGLSELVRLGLLRQDGVRRWTRYMLPEPKPPKPLVRTGRGNRSTDILAVLSVRPEASRREIEQELKMPAVTVLYWLRRLIKEGKIERTTTAKSRHAKYRMTK